MQTNPEYLNGRVAAGKLQLYVVRAKCIAVAASLAILLTR